MSTLKDRECREASIRKAGAIKQFLSPKDWLTPFRHITQPDSAHCTYVCVPVRRALVSPVVTGAENLPDPLGPRRPLLFIGKPADQLQGRTMQQQGRALAVTLHTNQFR